MQDIAKTTMSVRIDNVEGRKIVLMRWKMTNLVMKDEIQLSDLAPIPRMRRCSVYIDIPAVDI